MLPKRWSWESCGERGGTLRREEMVRCFCCAVVSACPALGLEEETGWRLGRRWCVARRRSPSGGGHLGPFGLIWAARATASARGCSSGGAWRRAAGCRGGALGAVEVREVVVRLVAVVEVWRHGGLGSLVRQC